MNQNSPMLFDNNNATDGPQKIFIQQIKNHTVKTQSKKIQINK